MIEREAYMNTASLFVSIPVASFRAPFAREYFETLPCPPPSTVFGMLLSLVGEPDRLAHEGAEIALALVSRPENPLFFALCGASKTVINSPAPATTKHPDFRNC